MMTIARNAIPLGVVLATACDNPNESPATGPSGRRLSVGTASVCALDDGGAVWCWGLNSAFVEYGVSAGVSPTSASPVAVPIPTLASVSIGNAQHMCGVTSAALAVCWGRGGEGQLGDGTDGATGNAVTYAQADAQWRSISVSRLSTCAVSTQGKGYCWGLNQRGNIGDTALAIGARVNRPSLVIAGIEFSSVVAGWLHSCGVATSGATYCWGDNTSGQLGIGTSDTDIHPRPLLVSFTEKFAQLSLGSRVTCGITVDKRAFCWGRNATGQLGDGTTTDRTTPTAVGGGLKFSQIATSDGFPANGTAVPVPVGGQGVVGHTCALATDGTPWCWGWNGAGQIGDGTTFDRLLPVAVQGNIHMTVIALGSASTCGMRDNSIWCWGSNLHGQLGNGSSVDSPVPVAVDA